MSPGKPRAVDNIVKLMLWISNLSPHLIEITCFQKHIDGLLTDMYMPRQNILPHKKQLRIHSFNETFLYTILIALPNRYLFKEIFWYIYGFFLKNGIA